MYKPLNSYLSPKLEARKTKYGHGVFAKEPVYKGELLTMWGGVVYSGKEYDKLPYEFRSRGIQIEDDLFLSPREIEQADYFNHSCNPNAGLSGQIALLAMRDIKANEQICFDYAMSDTSPYDEFDCECGGRDCRKRVTGNDWQLEELWDRYAGYFSPYIQRKIDLFRSQAIPVDIKPLVRVRVK